MENTTTIHSNRKVTDLSFFSRCRTVLKLSGRRTGSRSPTSSTRIVKEQGQSRLRVSADVAAIVLSNQQSAILIVFPSNFFKGKLCPAPTNANCRRRNSSYEPFQETFANQSRDIREDKVTRGMVDR